MAIRFWRGSPDRFYEAAATFQDETTGNAKTRELRAYALAALGRLVTRRPRIVIAAAALLTGLAASWKRM